MAFPLSTYAIILPVIFLAGALDAIAGGGGLLSVPAYLAAGIPPPLISYSPYRRDITFKPEIKKGFQFASDPEEEDEPRELKACAVIEPVQARRYLKHVGLDYESPPRAPPRFEQGEFDFEPNDWSSEHLS